MGKENSPEERCIFAKEVRHLELLVFWKYISWQKTQGLFTCERYVMVGIKPRGVKGGHKMPFLPAPHGLRSRVNGVYRIIFLELGHVFLQGCFPGIHALHHMKRAPMAYVSQRDESRPLAIKNWCPETIFPGIATQAGTPPEIQGFELKSGGSRNLTVGADWQGRVWGRTNCSFNADGTGPASGTFGRACKTGDCYGVVDCKVTVSCIPCELMC